MWASLNKKKSHYECADSIWEVGTEAVMPEKHGLTHLVCARRLLRPMGWFGDMGPGAT
jgi:hypothetical protein